MNHVFCQVARDFFGYFFTVFYVLFLPVLGKYVLVFLIFTFRHISTLKYSFLPFTDIPTMCGMY